VSVGRGSRCCRRLSPWCPCLSLERGALGKRCQPSRHRRSSITPAYRSSGLIQTLPDTIEGASLTSPASISARIGDPNFLNPSPKSPSGHTSPYPSPTERQNLGIRQARTRARPYPPTKGSAGGKQPRGNAASRSPDLSLSAACRKEATNSR